MSATARAQPKPTHRLAGRGHPVRALTRDPATADLPAGVEVVAGDLSRPDTLTAALDGVDQVFLLWPFFTAEHAPAVAAALAARPRHVVYLSAMNVRDDQDPSANGVWGEVEHALRTAGVDWTMLRAGGFATNTLEWADQAHTGTVRGPYGAAARSLIHERDLADVVALTDPARHAGAAHVRTGPESITMTDQARLIGEAIGCRIRWVDQPADEARDELAARLGDTAFAASAMAYWASLAEHPEPVTDNVERLTGRPARPYRDWAVDHAGDFRPPSTARVADEYVSLMRAGELDEISRLVSPDVVRVSPMETGGVPVERRGMAEIMENSTRLLADVEINDVAVEGPFLAADRFGVRFTFDQTHVPTGERSTTTKLSLYTVADGRITREEVFYYDAPQAVVRD